MKALQEAYNNWLHRYNTLLDWASYNQYHPKRDKAISLMAVLVGRLFNIVEACKELAMLKVPNYPEGSIQGSVPVTYDERPGYIIRSDVPYKIPPLANMPERPGTLISPDGIKYWLNKPNSPE